MKWLTRDRVVPINSACLLANIHQNRLRCAFLSEMREQKEQVGLRDFCMA
jgi:hypothetical protein